MKLSPFFFNHDLALLQQAMNAVGICSPIESENINTQRGISLQSLYAQPVLSEQYRSCAFSVQPIMTVSIKLRLRCNKGHAAETFVSLNQITTEFLLRKANQWLIYNTGTEQRKLALFLWRNHSSISLMPK
jgi:hypothetical protein